MEYVLLLSIIKNSIFKIGAYKIVIVCKIKRAFQLCKININIVNYFKNYI